MPGADTCAEEQDKLYITLLQILDFLLLSMILDYGDMGLPYIQSYRACLCADRDCRRIKRKRLLVSKNRLSDYPDNRF